jgi:MFS family permease
MTGDWILRVGLVYRVYALTGSTVASALTMASSFLPQVLLGALAGVFADRWDRRRTMIVANLLLAAGLLPLLLVRGAGQVWIVFAVLLFESIVQQFFSPAEQALLPRLVPDDQLITANAVSGRTQNLARLTGSGLGGVIAAASGIAGVALADAASFVISARPGRLRDPRDHPHVTRRAQSGRRRDQRAGRRTRPRAGVLGGDLLRGTRGGQHRGPSRPGRSRARAAGGGRQRRAGPDHRTHSRPPRG